MFEGVLLPADARRVARGVEAIIEHGLRPALAAAWLVRCSCVRSVA